MDRRGFQVDPFRILDSSFPFKGFSIFLDEMNSPYARILTITYLTPGVTNFSVFQLSETKIFTASNVSSVPLPAENVTITAGQRQVW